MSGVEERVTVVRALSTGADQFDICRHCGSELSFRGRYESSWWRDSGLGTQCPDGRVHERMPGAYNPEDPQEMAVDGGAV